MGVARTRPPKAVAAATRPGEAAVMVVMVVGSWWGACRIATSKAVTEVAGLRALGRFVVRW